MRTAVATTLAGLAALWLLLAAVVAFWGKKTPDPTPEVEAGPRVTPWGPLGPSERVLVIGVSGTGKTTYAKKLLSGGAGGPPAGRVVFFDPQADYVDVAVPVTLAELRAAPELLKGERVAVAVQPDGDTEEELAAEVEELCELVRKAGRLVVVLDEVGDYADAARKTLSRLARNGRHDGIASVWVTQAAMEIPKGVRRQATRVFSFLQTDPSDLSALERFGPQFVAQVRGWRKGADPAAWVLPSLAELPC